MVIYNLLDIQDVDGRNNSWTHLNEKSLFCFDTFIDTIRSKNPTGGHSQEPHGIISSELASGYRENNLGKALLKDPIRIIEEGQRSRCQQRTMHP